MVQAAGAWTGPVTGFQPVARQRELARYAAS
jgi:hypothetical protein